MRHIWCFAAAAIIITVSHVESILFIQSRIKLELKCGSEGHTVCTACDNLYPWTLELEKKKKNCSKEGRMMLLPREVPILTLRRKKKHIAIKQFQG